MDAGSSMTLSAWDSAAGLKAINNIYQRFIAPMIMSAYGCMEKEGRQPRELREVNPPFSMCHANDEAITPLQQTLILQFKVDESKFN